MWILFSFEIHLMNMLTEQKHVIGYGLKWFWRVRRSRNSLQIQTVSKRYAYALSLVTLKIWRAHERGLVQKHSVINRPRHADSQVRISPDRRYIRKAKGLHRGKAVLVRRGNEHDVDSSLFRQVSSARGSHQLLKIFQTYVANEISSASNLILSIPQHGSYSCSPCRASIKTRWSRSLLLRGRQCLPVKFLESFTWCHFESRFWDVILTNSSWDLRRAPLTVPCRRRRSAGPRRRKDQRSFHEPVATSRWGPSRSIHSLMSVSLSSAHTMSPLDGRRPSKKKVDEMFCVTSQHWFKCCLFVSCGRRFFFVSVPICFGDSAKIAVDVDKNKSHRSHGKSVPLPSQNMFPSSQQNCYWHRCRSKVSLLISVMLLVRVLRTSDSNRSSCQCAGWRDSARHQKSSSTYSAIFPNEYRSLSHKVKWPLRSTRSCRKVR